MKYILLILSMMLTFNVNASYEQQYKNAPNTDTFIVLKAQKRMKWLENQLFALKYKINNKTATSYDKALYKKYLSEYDYLLHKYGTR